MSTTLHKKNPTIGRTNYSRRYCDTHVFTGHVQSVPKIFYSYFRKIDTKPSSQVVIQDYATIEKITLPRTIKLLIKDKKIILSQELKDIAAAIQSSLELLDLQENWDDEGANATNIFAFENAVTFLSNYSQYIFNIYKIIIDAPVIDILRDGSISVFWETKNTRFLIIFKKAKSDYSFYYGEVKDQAISIPFNSAIKNSSEIDETTALWMSQKL